MQGDLFETLADFIKNPMILPNILKIKLMNKLYQILINKYNKLVFS